MHLAAVHEQSENINNVSDTKFSNRVYFLFPTKRLTRFPLHFISAISYLRF